MCWVNNLVKGIVACQTPHAFIATMITTPHLRLIYPQASTNSHRDAHPVRGALSCRIWPGLILMLACLPVAARGGDVSFGFTGPEIFPIEQGIANLRTADVDGDGLNDLIVTDNAHAKINVLYNQTGKTNAVESVPSTKKEINELPADARFKIDSLASEKRIHSLAVADLNEDHRPDVAYYGEPNELVVQYNEGKKQWSSPKRWPIADGQLTPNAMAAGDLTADGQTDLILLGESYLYLLVQTKDHTLAEPIRIPYSGVVKSVQVLDIDGNDRKDLLLVNWDSPNPFRFRLQDSEGHLGPETQFSMPPVRSYWADDLDADAKTEVITVAQNSGRAQIFNFARKPAAVLTGELHESQFQVLPLNKSGKAKRGMSWADVNGDSLTDLLVAEPDSGQLTLFLQHPDGSLPLAKTFPSLTGVSEMAVRRKDDASPAEIFLLSQDERQVAATQYDTSGRFGFPATIGLTGKPLTLASGPFQKGGPSVLAVIVEQPEGKVLWIRQADGTVSTQPLSADFRTAPSSMTFHDVDQDGLLDLVILIPYEKIKLLIQQAKGPFKEIDVAPPGGSLEQPWVSQADVDGDGNAELLLAQKNFVRAVVLKSEPSAAGDAGKSTWVLSVKDQINGATQTSRIVGAAALPRPGKKVPYLVLLDAERKGLSLCERDNERVWQIIRNLPLPFSEFNAIEPIALGSREPNSIAFMGLNAVGWMTFQGDRWELAELDGYETPIKNGRLMDVVSGDLNQDNRKDLVFLETARSHVDLVIFEPNGHLTPANRWQVFEERTFRSRRSSDQGEPREALIVDLTGDGKNDLALLVHDRILVYPQE